MFLGSILRLIQKKGRTALTTFFHHYDVPPNDMGTEAIDQTIRNQEPKQTCILLSCSCELLDWSSVSTNTPALHRTSLS